MPVTVVDAAAGRGTSWCRVECNRGICRRPEPRPGGCGRMTTGRRLLGAVLVAGLVLGTGAIVAAKANAALPGHYQGTGKNAGLGTAVPDGWQPFDRTSNGGRALQFKVATAGAAHRSTAKTPVTACPISPADLSGGTVSRRRFRLRLPFRRRFPYQPRRRCLAPGLSQAMSRAMSSTHWDRRDMRARRTRAPTAFSASR